MSTPNIPQTSIDVPQSSFHISKFDHEAAECAAGSIGNDSGVGQIQVAKTLNDEKTWKPDSAFSLLFMPVVYIPVDEKHNPKYQNNPTLNFLEQDPNHQRAISNCYQLQNGSMDHLGFSSLLSKMNPPTLCRDKALARCWYGTTQGNQNLALFKMDPLLVLSGIHSATFVPLQGCFSIVFAAPKCEDNLQHTHCLESFLEWKETLDGFQRRCWVTCYYYCSSMFQDGNSVLMMLTFYTFGAAQVKHTPFHVNNGNVSPLLKMIKNPENT